MALAPCLLWPACSPHPPSLPTYLDVSLVNVDFWYFKGEYNVSDQPFVKATYRSDTTCRLQTGITLTKCKHTTFHPAASFLKC